MKLMRALALPVLLLIAACPGDDVPSLQGAWTMVAFRADGADATITGTMTFAANGTVTAVGQVTFPGEAPDSLNDTGTWEQHGETLTMTIGGDTGTWALAFDGDRVVLQLQGDASASRLELERI